MVTKALEVETDNTNIATTAGVLNKTYSITSRRFQSQTSGTGNAPTASQTFFMFDSDLTVLNKDDMVSLAPAAYGTFNAQYSHSPDQGGQGMICMLCNSAEQPMQDYLKEYDSLSPEDQRTLSAFYFAGMSNGEYALQKSSGTTRPVECWGCKGPSGIPQLQRKFGKDLEGEVGPARTTKCRRFRLLGCNHVKRQTQRLWQQVNLQDAHNSTQRQHKLNGTRTCSPRSGNQDCGTL
jgi:hypothetical protein